MPSDLARPRVKKPKLDSASTDRAAKKQQKARDAEIKRVVDKLVKKKAESAKTQAPKRPIAEVETDDDEEEEEEADKPTKELKELKEKKQQKEEDVEEDEDAEVEAKTPETFEDLGLNTVLCEICTSLKYTKPTPIQKLAVPVALQNRDVIGTAQTGSGKTLAFALPMLHLLLEKPRPFFGLVLAPTRELAVQIGQTFDAFSSISLRTAVLLGGVDMVSQTIALGKRPHIIVATPGRLLDHLEKTKGFSLNSLRYLVIDEADRLLDFDFGPIFEKILRFLPRERRTMLFSATMSSKVESLQRASLRDPVRVSVKADAQEGPDGQLTVSTLKQNVWLVPHKDKDTAFVYLMNEFMGRCAIVFTRTVYETHRVALLLRALGFSAIPLNGKMSQSERLSAFNKIKAGSSDILVATDIAARGLDIQRINIVVNYDVPQDAKTYVHRVGRTARAGKSGHAVNIVTQYDLLHFLAIEKAIGMERKIDPLPINKEDVNVFRHRVEEAQRHAKAGMRLWQEKQDNKGKRRGDRKRGSGVLGGRNDDMDMEEQ
ncbi:ribosomal RNA processing protein [Sporothrix curviconia]|uniref:ATP-dependent rRNA helicase RRP3 n=1 Tax=Sporothrix curviconia TaxID=1260050 RepID=A0ABP0BYB1_9PEZI